MQSDYGRLHEKDRTFVSLNNLTGRRCMQFCFSNLGPVKSGHATAEERVHFIFLYIHVYTYRAE